MAIDRSEPDQVEPRREWRASRRVLLKAGAAFGVLAAGAGAVRSLGVPATSAQQGGSTRAQRWSETDAVSAAGEGEARIVEAEFPFFAIGASWPGTAGVWPLVELAFSADGEQFGEPVITSAAIEDGGRENRGGRVFSHLVFTGGERWVRYRVLDGSGNSVAPLDLELSFIDATSGPGTGGGISAAGLPLLEKPTVISRAGWGADESLRFDGSGEIWPPEYQKVEHIIIHHTVTSNTSNPAADMRAIYYYHAVEQGWGDIGYNYLVDRFGNIYEGRAGGPHVVAGHSFQYNAGSCGIGTLGTFSISDATEACQAGIIAMTAWVGRNLNPVGRKPFKEIANLPTICGHRDVGVTECPGDQLWADLPGIRTAVKEILDSTESPPDDEIPGNDGEFADGDNLIVVKGNNLRTGPSTSYRVVQKLNAGTLVAVVGAPRVVDGDEWYFLTLENEREGYAMGRFLDPAPTGNPSTLPFELGDRIRITIDGLNVRRKPGLAQPVLHTLPAGTLATITRDPVSANNRRWFAIQTTGNITGWVVQEGFELRTRRKLVLSHTSGPVGRVVTATYSGMPINTSVTLQFNNEDVTVGSTDSTGAGSLQFRVPVQAKNNWIVRVMKGRARAYNRYQIEPRIKLSPSSGVTGASIVTSLTGYAAGESISIDWQRGSSWEQIATVNANQLGSAGLPITVPDWASGRQIVRGQGTQSLFRTTFTTTGTGSTGGASDDPTPSPTATATPQPSVTATPEPTATPSPEPSPTEEPTSTPTPEPTATATATPTEPPEEPTIPPEPTGTPES